MVNRLDQISLKHEPVDPHMVSQMMFFIVLVESHSLTRASEVMDISTSTGSRWLSDLESTLGTPLYRRNDKANRITEAGDHLYQRFKKINTDIEILKSELTEFTQECRGNIRICSTPAYAERVLIPIIAEFTSMYPEVNIQLTISPRGLENHQDNDFIITAVSESIKDKDQDLNLVRRNLVGNRFVVVASPLYIKRNFMPETPEDLLKLRCLYSKVFGDQNNWVFKKNDEEIIIGIEKSIELSDVKMINAAAVSDAGVAILPYFNVKSQLQEGKLIRLLDNYDMEDWLLNLYYSPRRFMTNTVKTFKEFFLQHQRHIDERTAFSELPPSK